MRRPISVSKNHVLNFDVIYRNKMISKMINFLMKDGKKVTSEKIFYNAMIQIRSFVNDDPLNVVLKSIDNSKPLVELKSIRIGGVTHQIPIETSLKRQNSLAIRWIVEHAQNRSEKKMSDRLAKEILDIYHNKGLTIQKKEELHKRAESNRAFAHYRW
jgi:small subunit ribosomal protein S7